MKNLIFILIAVFITACSLKQEANDINSYSIDTPRIEKIYKNSSKSIFIEKPAINSSFNSRAIFYSTKPYLYEEYVKNRWINLPSNMIHSSLVDAFESSKSFSLVSQEKSDIKYDYILSSNVIKLYHEIETNSSNAILKIKFDLSKDEKVIKTFTYEKRVQVLQNNPYEFVNSTNKAFSEIVVQLLKDINSL